MGMRLTALVVAVLGCGGAVQYGSFLSGRPALQQALALDAADKVRSEYDGGEGAAVMLMHPAADPFGRALASQLREEGFRVSHRADEHSHGVALAYVADAIKGTDLLRVVVELNGRRFSRAYRPKGDGVKPAGPWTVSGGHHE